MPKSKVRIKWTKAQLLSALKKNYLTACKFVESEGRDSSHEFLNKIQRPIFEAQGKTFIP